ncbi:hypothetical protein ANTRET_LOCUS102 [Anthophora retusa]
MFGRQVKGLVISFNRAPRSRMEQSYSPAQLLDTPCMRVFVCTVTVAACYPRRTSRVSVENKRHVVYTSTDDPIEIAKPFFRLNE